MPLSTPSGYTIDQSSARAADEERRAMAIAENYARERVRPPVGVVIDPHVQRSASGLFVLHCQYHYRFIPLFLTSSVLRVADHAGEVSAVGDEPPHVADVDVVPAAGAAEAVAAVASHLLDGGSADSCAAEHPSAPRKRRVRNRLLNVFPLPSRPTVLSAGNFAAPVMAHLALYENGLVWVVQAQTREREEYIVLVAADDTAPLHVVLCERVTTRACSGSIFLFSPSEAARVAVDLPRPLAAYPAAFQGRAAGLKLDWIASDSTIGNNAETFLNNAKRTVRAAKAGGQLVFARTPGDTDDAQCLLNAFFFCNFMHDFFAMLGFDETAGNFQLRNHGASKGAGDRLKIKVSKEKFPDVGQMFSRRDGMTAEMFLGVHPETKLPGALDGDILIHEYTHGVTQRFIGGRRNSEALIRKQSRAMGEGWSDFFAITIQNFYRDRDKLPPRFTFAEYSTGGALRSQAYDIHRGTFGDIGRPPHDTDHGAGEIWAAALIDFTRRLTGTRGAEAGYALAWQIVFESFSHVAANPTFLEGRDAVFEAITRLGADAAALHDAREAFRLRGMGRDAVGGTAASFAGIRADTTA